MSQILERIGALARKGAEKRTSWATRSLKLCQYNLSDSLTLLLKFQKDWTTRSDFTAAQVEKLQNERTALHSTQNKTRVTHRLVVPRCKWRKREFVCVGESPTAN